MLTGTRPRSICMFASKSMPRETLKEGHDWAWHEFYSLHLHLAAAQIWPALLVGILYRKCSSSVSLAGETSEGRRR